MTISRQPETISEVGEVVNVSSVDLVDEVTNVTSVDTVDLVTTVSEVSNVTSVDTVDTVTEVANVTSVDTVDTLTAITNPVITLDHLLEVAQGNITGQSLIHKFGWAEDINTGAPQAVWDGQSDTAGGYPDADYTMPSDTAVTMYISSSNATDTQDYEIQGLDANFVAQTVTQTAAGQTVTEIGSGKTWTRVFRVKNVGATDNAGIIFINNADDHTAGVPDVAANIAAIVTIGNNQTLMAIYTVPAATTAYLLRAYYSCGKGEDFQVNLCARPLNGVFQIKDKQFLYQRYMENDFEGGVSFAAKTDIMVKASSVTTTNKPMAAGFDLLLVAD